MVVVPERDIQYAVEQLNRIVRELKDLFVVSPVTRYSYVYMPCCISPEHVTTTSVFRIRNS
jgi:hypothetical protein